MVFYETWEWSLVSNMLFGSVLIWVAAMTVRKVSVRGTRRRYVAATVERALMYPAAACWAMGLVESVAEQDAFRIVLNAIILLDSIREIRNFHRNDDDDWFTGAGKRLRRWLASRMPSLSSPLPSAAGA